MKYQLTEALPWWFNRWVLRRKNGELRPLYQFDTSSDEDRVQALYAADKSRTEKREIDANGGGLHSSSEGITQEKIA